MSIWNWYSVEYERTHGMWLVVEKDTERLMGYHHDKDTAKEVCDVLNADKARSAYGGRWNKSASAKATGGGDE